MGSLGIEAYEPFDCNSLGAEYAKIMNSTQTGKHQLLELGFYCDAPPKPRFHLSTRGKVGVGLGASITGLTLFILFILWKRRRDAAKEANRLPGYSLASLDPVPKYPHVSTTEEEAEGGENGGPGTHPREEPDEGLHPPAYDDVPRQPRENVDDRGNEVRTQ